MTKSSLLLSVGLVVLPACAEMTYRTDVGAVFPVVKGQIALQNAAGDIVLHNNQQDIESNMGLGDTEVSPYLHLQTDGGRHRVRLHAFYSDAEGSGTVTGDRGYGGIATGSQVTTSLEFYAVQATYGYQVFRDDHFRIGLGGTIGAYGFDLAARSATNRDEVETSLIVPMLYVEAEAYLGPVIVGGDAGIIAGDFRDGDGRYGDVEAFVKAVPHENFELMAGYRYVLLDAHGTATSRDFDADLEIRGFFLGGGVRF